MPLGIFAYNDYTQNKVTVQPGDAIIFYTDGITEAMNSASEEFGLDRLRTVILDHEHAPAEELAAAIETAVNQFSGSVTLFDDFTLMIVRRKPHNQTHN